MAATPRGTMRSNGRSPPFLAIGLFVALCILGFNYWSLSAKNSEQSNEIAIIESELRLVNAKKLSSEKRAEAVSDKIKDLEDDLQQHKSSFANKASENSLLQQVMQQEVNTLKLAGEQEFLELNECSKERTTAVDSLSHCQGELAVEQNKVHECDENKCSNYIMASRQLTLDNIVKVSGLGALVPLQSAGGDIGSYGPELQQLAQNAQQQQYQQQMGGANQQPQVDTNIQQPQVGGDNQQPQVDTNIQQPQVGGDNQQPQVDMNIQQPQVGGDNQQPQAFPRPYVSRDKQQPQVEMNIQQPHVGGEQQPGTDDKLSGGNNQQSQNAAGQDGVNQIPSPDVNQPAVDDAHKSENRPIGDDNPESPQVAVQALSRTVNTTSPATKSVAAVTKPRKVVTTSTTPSTTSVANLTSNTGHKHGDENEAVGDGPNDNDDYADDDDDDVNDGMPAGDGPGDDAQEDGDNYEDDEDDVDDDYYDDDDPHNNAQVDTHKNVDGDNVADMQNEDNTFEEMREKIETGHL